MCCIFKDDLCKPLNCKKKELCLLGMFKYIYCTYNLFIKQHFLQKMHSPLCVSPRKNSTGISKHIFYSYEAIHNPLKGFRRRACNKFILQRILHVALGADSK